MKKRDVILILAIIILIVVLVLLSSTYFGEDKNNLFNEKNNSIVGGNSSINGTNENASIVNGVNYCELASDCEYFPPWKRCLTLQAEAMVLEKCNNESGPCYPQLPETLGMTCRCVENKCISYNEIE